MSAVAAVDSSEPEVICCGCCKKSKKPQTQTSLSNNDTTEDQGKRVPFSADLPKEFGVGTAVYVTGIILPNCSRFSVNLTCGRALNRDIAFHFNPRIQMKYVVRNSRLNGLWGEEETAGFKKFDFERGKKINLCFFMGDGEYFVALDGEHLCTYKWRVALSKVTAIDVEGGLDVLKVDYKRLDLYPEVLPKETAALQRGGDGTAMDPPVTFLLPGGFQQGWQLEIYGRIKILPHSFYVNLQQGAHLWPHPVIPIHVNPRFSMHTGELFFVRNAWIEGGWGQEECAPGFQFTPGSPFTMAIQRSYEHFYIWVAGKLAGEFKFRGPVDKIDTVHIQGDVVLFDVVLNKTAKLR